MTTAAPLYNRQVFLLAAGKGARAGGPKAWRSLGGRPALARQLESLLEVLTPGQVAVSIQRPWLERCEGLSEAVRWVSVDPEASPLASLQALAKAGGAPAFLYHVDMGPFEPGVFRALDAALDGACDACAPVFGGRRGHPVLLSDRLYAPLLALDPAKDRLDAFLRARQVREVPVGSAAVLDNRNA